MIPEKNIPIVAAVIGASNEAIYAIKTAQDLGICVIALDGNPYAGGFSYSDKTYVVDINDIKAVVDILKKEKVSFIIPVPIGRCLTTIGAANTLLNLPGIQQYSTELCTDKMEFHNKMKRAGLRNIYAYLVNKDNKKAIIEMNLPVIIKPRYGSGSHGVTMINDSDELINSINRTLGVNEEYICETAVSGEEYGLDGVVVNGKLNVILLRRKIITDPPMRQCVGYFTIPRNVDTEKLYADVEAYMEQVTSELKLDSCIIHADLMININGVFLIEISGRPSGHNLHDVLVPLATGIDMVKEFLKYQLGKEYDFNHRQIKYMALHFWNFEKVYVEKIPDIGTLNLIPNLNLIRYQCDMVEGEYLDVIKDDAVLKRGYFIVTGDSLEDITSQCHSILNKFVVRYI